MMMSKIMVQNFALTLSGPSEVLETVNNRICTNSVEEMFVTVWLGFLDLRTGLLTAANAGHEYPILKAPDGDFELLKDKHGLVVGGMEGYPYKEYQVQLEAGSRLFLYTDGLPEATDTENHMFGIERTLKALNEVKNDTPREVLDHVTQSVADFVGSAPQFDDTTMMCLDYKGAEI
jgi:serine phosphatase RsbU (regulator of sigma subunit)